MNEDIKMITNDYETNEDAVLVRQLTFQQQNKDAFFNTVPSDVPKIKITHVDQEMQ